MKKDNKTKVHIVPHTHWDREWYFTDADSLVLSDQIFSDILDELSKNEKATFVLDGQVSILDDYLVLFPEKINQIKELVQKKKLFIGPWFTQTDCLYPKGESILRNLMIGTFEAQKYGSYLDIGYLPDTFGFNEQMPMILKSAGFDSIVFWRGINYQKHVSSPYFKWQEKSGKDYIYAMNLPQGYGTGMLLEATSNFVDGRLDPAVDFIKNLSENTPDEVLIPSGNDQLNIINDMPQIIDEINNIGKYEYKNSTYKEFLEYVKSLSNLESYKGEFREPTLARVHRTIGSSRMDIKVETSKFENKLINRLEPLLVIARKCNMNISNRLLLKAWKNLLKCQAHDSLGACVSDPVAIDILHRIKEANEIADSIENTILKNISDHLDLSENEVLVVNTEVKPFSGIKTVSIVSKHKNIRFDGIEDAFISGSEWIDSRENTVEETPSGNREITEEGYYKLEVNLSTTLPALGYTVLRFSKSDKDLPEYEKIESNIIEGLGIRLTYKEGKVVCDYQGRKTDNFIYLVDEGNMGDTYDFSPLDNDIPIICNFQSFEVYDSEKYAKMILKGENKLPANLAERSEKIISTLFTYQITLTLNKTNGSLRGEVNINNVIDSHRMRLVIDSLVEEIPEVTSAIPYGFTDRKVDIVDSWQEKYLEYPVDVFPLGDHVTLHEKNWNLTVFSKEFSEFQIQDKKRIALTLLATTDQLGKPNLTYRPGRASGDTTKKGHVFIPTPLAQLRKKMNFTFMVQASPEGMKEENVWAWNKEYLSENISYQKQVKNRFIHRIDNKIQVSHRALKVDDTMSALSVGKYIFVAACYPSYYDEDSFIVRLENPTNEEVSIPNELCQKGEVVDGLKNRNEVYINTIDPYSVISLKFKY